MTSLLITGYKSFELGVFKDKDPKVNIIKKAIKRDLKRFLDEGVDWMIFTGNLGFEFWALEVAKELQKDYPLRRRYFHLKHTVRIGVKLTKKNWQPLNKLIS